MVVYGLHLWNYQPLGEIGVKEGPIMAAADMFDIIVKGKGGHGATPQGTIDAIVVASHLVTALQTIVSRDTNPLENTVVTIGEISGGENFNVIADKQEEYGFELALSLSDPFCVKRHKDDFLKLIEKKIKIIFSNQEEIESLFNCSMENALLKASNKALINICTQGGNGSTLCKKGKFIKSNAFTVNVKDTTGAGDNFAAGFLHGYINNYSLSKCSELGNYCAAETVKVIGGLLAQSTNARQDKQDRMFRFFERSLDPETQFVKDDKTKMQLNRFARQILASQTKGAKDVMSLLQTLGRKFDREGRKDDHFIEMFTNGRTGVADLAIQLGNHRFAQSLVSNRTADHHTLYKTGELQAIGRLVSNVQNRYKN